MITSEFAKMAGDYGLFVALVVYVLWESRQREQKYLAVIQTLSEDVKERLGRVEAKLGIAKKDGVKC